jgi:hypothetical protein
MGHGNRIDPAGWKDGVEQEKSLTNWPWMSPQTVTGHLTGCTFDSSIRISRVCENHVGKQETR